MACFTASLRSLSCSIIIYGIVFPVAIKLYKLQLAHNLPRRMYSAVYLHWMDEKFLNSLFQKQKQRMKHTTWQGFIDLNTSSRYVTPWEASEYVPVLTGDTCERLYSDTDRHHYTLSCFPSPSMKCHSELSVLSLCHGCALSFSPHFSFSRFAWSLSFTLHFPQICVRLPALSLPTLAVGAHDILTLPLFISSSSPFLFALLSSTTLV